MANNIKLKKNLIAKDLFTKKYKPSIYGTQKRKRKF